MVLADCGVAGGPVGVGRKWFWLTVALQVVQVAADRRHCRGCSGISRCRSAIGMDLLLRYMLGVPYSRSRRSTLWTTCNREWDKHSGRNVSKRRALGDGGEEGKRVSRAFSARENFFPSSRWAIACTRRKGRSRELPLVQLMSSAGFMKALIR